jgi:hypothetical protein
MKDVLLTGEIETPTAAFSRGRVVSIDQGLVIVARSDGDPRQWACEMIEQGTDRCSALAPGDVVLAWLPPASDARGVIIGRIVLQPTVGADPTEAASPAATVVATPDTLVLEAKHSLTLRVGDGSITIREDGKILIKGKDLVSHAQRMNRIKGGAVSIN